MQLTIYERFSGAGSTGIAMPQSACGADIQGRSATLSTSCGLNQSNQFGNETRGWETGGFDESECTSAGQVAAAGTAALRLGSKPVYPPETR